MKHKPDYVEKYPSRAVQETLAGRFWPADCNLPIPALDKWVVFVSPAQIISACNIMNAIKVGPIKDSLEKDIVDIVNAISDDL
jgi:hypothetical protein